MSRVDLLFESAFGSPECVTCQYVKTTEQRLQYWGGLCARITSDCFGEPDKCAVVARRLRDEQDDVR
ncbi:MAG: hypothetical protein ACYCOU_01340 [Sulfobacillus sp.]